MLFDVSLIFETPWPVLTAALIVLAVVVIIRQAWPDNRRWWQLVIPVILVASAFGLDYFFDTDYEKIESIIDSGIEAVVEQNVGQIDGIVSPDYSDSRHRSKASLMGFCRDLLSQPFVERIKRQQEQVTISVPEAEAEISVRLHLYPQNPYSVGGTLMYVKMKLYLTRTAYGNWLISRIDIISINNQPLNWGSVQYQKTTSLRQENTV